MTIELLGLLTAVGLIVGSFAVAAIKYLESYKKRKY